MCSELSSVSVVDLSWSMFLFPCEVHNSTCRTWCLFCRVAILNGRHRNTHTHIGSASWFPTQDPDHLNINNLLSSHDTVIPYPRGFMYDIKFSYIYHRYKSKSGNLDIPSVDPMGNEDCFYQMNFAAFLPHLFTMLCEVQFFPNLTAIPTCALVTWI